MRSYRLSVLGLLFMLMTFQICQSQDWMTSLDAAKRLALVQNKMILMMWEESTLQKLPVVIKDDKGNQLVIEDLFKSELLNTKIWEHFVPVSVSESMYAELYDAIKDERDYAYISKFSDNSVKIIDVNGNILNVEPDYGGVLNLSKLINTYYLNTTILRPDLINYSKDKNFITAYRLGVRYIDIAIYCNSQARFEVVKLSNIYLSEAEKYLEEGDFDNKSALIQKIRFFRLKQQLILGNPKKVLRLLKRLEPSDIDKTNEALVAFLYLTSYRILKDEKSASIWRSKVSLANMEKSKQIIDNYK